MENPDIDKKIHFSPEWVQMLNKISDGILKNTNFSITTDEISKLLKNHLNIIAAACYMLEEDRKLLGIYSFSESRLTDVLSLLPGNMYDIKYDVNDTSVLITKGLRENKIVQSKKLEDFFYPVVKPKWLLSKIQDIIGAQLCIAIPIRINEIPQGIYFIVTKQESFSDLQLSLAQFYANLTGIAFDYSRKLLQLEAKYLLEKETSATLAHELKTPIAIAHNNVDTLANLLELKKDCQDEVILAKRSQEAISKLNNICNSVMSLHEVETQKLSTIHELHLEHSFLAVIENFEAKVKEKGLNFRYSVKFQPGRFYGGGVQFEQILIILLDNALKYTEKGSVEVLLESNGEILRATVCNTGYKISKNKRKAIFERFYRHRDEKNGGLYRTSGLGLGLYIASKLTEHLQGSIQVGDWPENEGNQFVVEIPIYTYEQVIGNSLVDLQ